jgi:hypothetical protein
MRGAKRSVKTGPNTDVTSININTALSIVPFNICSPACEKQATMRPRSRG